MIFQCFIPYKVHMHAGAISYCMVCACVREDNPLNYLPVHTHKPYNNLHLNVVIEQTTISIRKWVYISVKH